MKTQIISLDLGQESKEAAGKKFIHAQEGSKSFSLFTSSEELQKILDGFSLEKQVILAWGAKESGGAPEADFFFFQEVTREELISFFRNMMLGEIAEVSEETAKQLKALLKKSPFLSKKP